MTRTKQTRRVPKGSLFCKTCDAHYAPGSEQAHKSGKKHQILEEAYLKRTSKASRSIYVKNMPSGVHELELTEYFSKYAPVSSVYFPRSKGYCFVEFSCQVEDLDVLKVKHHLRGQELVVNQAVPGSRTKEYISAPVDITKGPQIMSWIRDISPLDNQIKTFLSLVQLSETELLERGDFVACLTSSLQHVFPGSRLEIFGSTANGLGFTGCDIDLSFFLPIERDERQVTSLDREQVPSLYDVYSEKFPLENLFLLSKENLLLFLARFISQLPGFKYARLIPSARCPIIKFHHKASNICGDISFCKSLGLANTHLLRLYGRMDFNVYALMMTLRFWGKREQFVGSNHLISSYAFSWLIIFYLQKRNLVPTVETLASLSDLRMEAESWDCTFCDNLDVIPVRTGKPFVELITGFFDFYTKFDFTAYVICPRDGSCAVKSELIAEAGDELDFKIASMSVQDVFDLTHNITGSVNDATIQTFLSKCDEQLTIWRMAKQVSLRHLFEPNPGDLKPLPPAVCNKDALFVSLVSSAATGALYDVAPVCSFILDIFKRAFLLDCKVIKSSPSFSIHKTSPNVRNSEETPTKKMKPDSGAPQFICTVTCNACYRTWVGRKKAKGFVSTSASQLDIEENIAREIVKNNVATEKAGSVLYKFDVSFFWCQDTSVLKIPFVPVGKKNELIFNVIPYIKKYILNLTSQQHHLQNYVQKALQY